MSYKDKYRDTYKEKYQKKRKTLTSIPSACYRGESMPNTNTKINKRHIQREIQNIYVYVYMLQLIWIIS